MDACSRFSLNGLSRTDVVPARFHLPSSPRASTRSKLDWRHDASRRAALYTSNSSSRLQMTAATASTSASPSPPCIWDTITETVESAAREAGYMRQALSHQVQHALGTSLESLRATTAHLPATIQEIGGSLQERVEETTFESSREIFRLNAKYKISEQIGEAASGARLLLEDLDCRYQFRQRFRHLQWEFFYQLSILLKFLHVLRQSMLFPYVAGAVVTWMLLTGILGNLIVYTLWTLPFIPVLARAAARFALIEGHCPSCGHHFIGPRKNTLSCRQCSAVVWRPRTKSRSSSGSKEQKEGPRPLVVVDITPCGGAA